MLTAALDGLVARFGLAGERLGEVVAGAVLKHSRDFNLTREAVLGSSLSPTTPAYDIQQACGTGLEAAILVANKIALGQVDSGIAGGVDSASDAPIAVSEGLRAELLRAEPRQDARPTRRKAALAFRPDRPRRPGARATPSRAPACRWASTWRSPPRSGASPARPRTSSPLASHHNLAAAYERGFFDDLLTPYLGLTRDQNLRPDSTLEKLAHAQAGLRQGRGRDDDGRQLHAADRRRLRRAARLARSGPPRTACPRWPGSSTARPPPSTTSTATRAC